MEIHPPVRWNQRVGWDFSVGLPCEELACRRECREPGKTLHRMPMLGLGLDRRLVDAAIETDWSAPRARWNHISWARTLLRVKEDCSYNS
jgi:hypothetical protein